MKALLQWDLTHTRFLLTGSIVNIVLGFLIATIFVAIGTAGFDIHSPALMRAAFWVVFASSVLYFGVAGLREMPVLKNGIPTFLGRRIDGLTVYEGLFWLLPTPLMGTEDFDMKERTRDFPGHTALSKDKNVVKFDGSLQYAIADIHKFVKLEEPDKAIATVYNREVFYLMSQHDILDIPGLVKEMTEELAKAMKNEGADWGIEFKRTPIENLMPPPELTAAIEKHRVEEAQGKAEKSEALRLRENVLAFIEGTDMDFERGLEALQAERNKIRKHVIRGDAVGDFTRGSVIKGDGR